MGTRYRAAAAVALTGLLCLGPGAGAAGTKPVRVVKDGGAFALLPAVKKSVKGRNVKWVNETKQPHTLVFYKAPGNLPKDVHLSPKGSGGDTKKRRFKKVGAYKYFCTQQGHSQFDGQKCTAGMCGKIRVRAPD